MSGIIGANGNVVGSAPDVSFGAMSPLPCHVLMHAGHHHAERVQVAYAWFRNLFVAVYYVSHRSVFRSATGAYRVFSCDGSTGANTILIAAAEQAYEDGMDIINLCASTPLCSEHLRPGPLPLCSDVVLITLLVSPLHCVRLMRLSGRDGEPPHMLCAGRWAQDRHGPPPVRTPSSTRSSPTWSTPGSSSPFRPATAAASPATLRAASDCAFPRYSLPNKS